MLAALEDRRAGDERRLVAVDPLDESPAVRRHVVHELGLLHLQTIEIDQVEVVAQARREPAAVGEAEEIGGLARLAPDQQIERQPGPALPVARPMGEDRKSTRLNSS